MAHVKPASQSQQPATRGLPSPQPRTAPQTTRRSTLLSVAGWPLLAWTPGSLLDAIKGEASLWQQEAQLYGRKAAEALTDATGGAPPPEPAAAAPPLDPSLAAALLAAPLQALQQAGSSTAALGEAPEPPPLPALDVGRYERDRAALLARELPYFQKAGACGHCGAEEGPEALSDPAWFDFLSYVQFKALARQLGDTLAASGAAAAALSGWERMHAGSPEMQLHAAPSPQEQLEAAEQAWLATGQRPGAGGAYGGTPEQQRAAAAAAYRARAGAAGGGGAAAVRLTPADALRLAVGGLVLAHVEADLAAAVPPGTVSPAATGAGSGAQGWDGRGMLDAIRSSSPELDAVRRGAQALLAYFASRGLVASAAVAFFGASKAEERNHYTWSLGEPAFLKYWLQQPAALRSTAALDAEEGFSQDYVAAALQAYFRRCGVAATALKRYPSLSQADLVAEQWTLRRLAPLPPGYDWQSYAEWQPDFCPLADEACY